MRSIIRRIRTSRSAIFRRSGISSSSSRTCGSRNPERRGSEGKFEDVAFVVFGYAVNFAGFVLAAVDAIELDVQNCSLVACDQGVGVEALAEDVSYVVARAVDCVPGGGHSFGDGAWAGVRGCGAGREGCICCARVRR